MVEYIKGRNRWDDEDNLPYQEYLNLYYSEHSHIVERWAKYINDYVNWAFSIETEEDYQRFIDAHRMRYFHYKEMKQFYEELKSKNYPLDDDVLKCIAVLWETGYFDRRTHSNFDEWLNDPHPNNFPGMQIPEDNGYKGNSFLSLTKYKYGMNVIRERLLGCFRY
ncbi:MAG: hypothetical protein H6Q20_2070 [Bacteroidetes bacterium]|nr:hypothetical protein [Bacteroidota bacterium]